MSVIVDVVNAVVDVYDLVQDFITEGIYNLLTQFTALFIKWVTVAYWKLKLAALQFSYDVAMQMMVDLQLSQYLQLFFGALDSRVASMLQFFRIPEAINIVVSAFFTKFVFRFFGF